MSSTPFVPQGSTFIAYTPSANILPYQYATFYLTEDATVSIVDKDGNTSNSIPFKAGYHPILVQKITAVSNGTVYIMKHFSIG